jgi:hypothetical protein
MQFNTYIFCEILIQVYNQHELLTRLIPAVNFSPASMTPECFVLPNHKNPNRFYSAIFFLLFFFFSSYQANRVPSSRTFVSNHSRFKYDTFCLLSIFERLALLEIPVTLCLIVFVVFGFGALQLRRTA